MSAGHTVYKVTFYSVILLFVVIIDWTVTPLNESPECMRSHLLILFNQLSKLILERKILDKRG